jgi:O-antigen ligase
MILAALAALLSTLTSISPRTSLHGHHEHRAGLVTVLALVVVYFSTRAVFRGQAEARRWFLGITFALVPIVGYSLVQISGHDPLVWYETSTFAGWVRPFGTLGHANHLGGYLVMALPLVAWLAWQLDRGGRPKAALALAVLALLGCAVVVASLSRAAWLAGALAVLLLAALGRPRFRWESSRRHLLILAVALAVGAGSWGIHAWRAEPQADLRKLIAERIGHLTERSSRLALWYTAYRIFRSSPWTGTGPETFDLAFGPNRREDYWRAEWGLIPTRAHNDLLNTLAAEGAAGGAAFLLLASMILWGACRALRFGETTTIHWPLP